MPLQLLGFNARFIINIFSSNSSAANAEEELLNAMSGIIIFIKSGHFLSPHDPLLSIGYDITSELSNMTYGCVSILLMLILIIAASHVSMIRPCSLAVHSLVHEPGMA